MMMNWLQSAYFGVILISLSIQAIDMSERANLTCVMCRLLSGLAAFDTCLVIVAAVGTVLTPKFVYRVISAPVLQPS